MMTTPRSVSARLARVRRRAVLVLFAGLFLPGLMWEAAGQVVTVRRNLSAAQPAVVEEGTASITFDVTVTAIPGGTTVEVDMQTIDGTRNSGHPATAPSQSDLRLGSDYAVAGLNYTAAAQTLSWADTESGVTRTFTVQLLNNTITEHNRDVFVRSVRQRRITAGGTATIEATVGTFFNGVGHPGGVAFVGNQGILGNYLMPGVCSVTIIDEDQPSGALDRTWNLDNVGSTVPPLNPLPGANNNVNAVIVDAAGRSVIGGDFIAYNSQSASRIARVATDGSFDTTFNPGAGLDAFVSAIALYTNTANLGKLVLGGGFTSFNGLSRNSIVRINANGSLDTTFAPGSGFNGPVRAVALQADGKVIAVGSFTTFNSVGRTNIARLNVDGSLDTTFTPGTGPNNTLYAVAIDPVSGKIYIGGDFTTYNGTPRNRIARVNTDGLLDTTFDPGTGADAVVYSILVQSDLRLLVAGNFLTVNQTSRSRMVRLTTAGAVDTTFSPGTGADNYISAMALDAAGKPYIVGAFTAFNSTGRKNVARLFTDGTVDTTFMDTMHNWNAGPTNATSFLNCVAVQADGNVMVGGSFTGFGAPYSRTSGTTPSHGSSGGNLVGFTPTSSINSDPNANTLTGGGMRWSFAKPRANLARLLELGVAGTPGPGNVEFEVASYFVDESDSLATIRFRRFGGIKGPMQPVFTTSDGSAQAGVDYTPLATTVGYPQTGLNARELKDGDAGITTLGVTITPDTRNEPNETINMALTAQPNQTLQQFTLGGSGVVLNQVIVTNNPAFAFQKTAILTIADDDFLHGVLGFSAADYTVLESAGTATLTVTRTNGSSGVVTVNYVTAPGTAVAGSDYTTTANTLTFQTGESNKTFTVPVTDDVSVEPDETIILTLSAATGGATLGLSVATLTIIDNDFPAGRISFSQATYTVSETASSVLVAVNRTGGSVGSATATLTAQTGTATLGVHYAGVTTNLSWGNGDASARPVAITVFDNFDLDGSRAVNLGLNNFTGSVGGNFTNAVLTITDDDTPGTLSFSAQGYSITENGGIVTITVVRTGGRGGPVTAQYSTPQITAIPYPGSGTSVGSDYTNTSGTVSLNPGVTSASFQIGIIDNSVTNVNKTVGLVLSNATGGATLRFGVVDPQFNLPGVGVNGLIRGFAAYTGGTNLGKFIIAGDFTSVNGIPRNRVARFNPDGSVDESFNIGTGANGVVRAIAIEPGSGKVLLGGDFTTFGAATLRGVTQLTQDGSVDGGFTPADFGVGTVIHAVAYDGIKPVLGGAFASAVVGATATNFARLTANGNLDLGVTVTGGAVRALLLDGTSYVLGGDFTAAAGGARVALAKVANTGVLDAGFNAAVAGTLPTVQSLALDGTNYLFAGTFTTVGGQGRASLARVAPATGALDVSLNPGTGPNAVIRSVVRDSSGRLIIGGDFTTFNGTTLTRFGRLTSNGTIDAAFNTGNSGADAPVYAIGFQPVGALSHVVLAGDFYTVNNTVVSRLARLNSTAVGLDSDFNLGREANGTITGVLRQPDGRLLIIGTFTSYNGVTRNLIARLNPNGTLDGNFDAGVGPVGVVSSVAVDTTTGAVVLGGAFSGFDAGISGKAFNANTGTITTTAAHRFPVGITVNIISVDNIFNGIYQIAAVPNSTSFTFVRTNGLAVASRSIAAGTATIATTQPHALVNNQTVTIAGLDPVFNGRVSILNVPDSSHFTFTRAYSVPIIARSYTGFPTLQLNLTTATPHGLVAGNSVALTGLGSGQDGNYSILSVPSASTFVIAYSNLNTVTFKQYAAGVAQLSTTTPHNLNVGESILIGGVDPLFNGTFTATAGTSGSTLNYVPTALSSALNTVALNSGLATVTTPAAHNLRVGDTIALSNVLASPQVSTVFQGRWTVLGTPSANSFTFSRLNSSALASVQVTTNRVTFTTSLNHRFAISNRVDTFGASLAGLLGGELQRMHAPILSLPSASSFTVDLPTYLTVSAKEVLNNVVTLTTATPHGFLVGDRLLIRTGDPVFDGLATVTGVGASTLTYARVTPNLVQAPAGGTITRGPSAVITTKASAFGTATLTTAAPHGLLAGQRILVSIGDALFDGEWTLTGASGTTLSYISGSPVTVTAVAGSGAVISTAFGATVVTKTISGNAATLTTAANHNFAAGQTIVVSLGDAAFDGVVTLTGVTATTLTYSRVGADTTGAAAGAVAFDSLSATALVGDTASLTTETDVVATAAGGSATVTVLDVALAAVSPPGSGTTELFAISPAALNPNATVTLNTFADLAAPASAQVITGLVNQRVVTKSFGANSVTLTTAGAHLLSPGDTVSVSNVDDVANGTYTVSTVPFFDALTFARVFTNNVLRKELRGNTTLRITTDRAHNLTTVANQVSITGVDAVFNVGPSTVTAVLASNIFEITRLQVAPAVSGYIYSGGVVTFTNTVAHGFSVGDTVTVSALALPTGLNPFNRAFTVASVPGTTRFTASFTPTAAIASRSLSANVATITTTAVHGFRAGDTVTISGVDVLFNGTHIITTTPSTTSFTFAKTSGSFALTPCVPVGTASLALATSGVQTGVSTLNTVPDTALAAVGVMTLNSVATVAAGTEGLVTLDVVPTTTVSPIGTARIPVGNLVRLNPDGSLDVNFTRNLGTAFTSGTVRAVAVDSATGDIVLGGDFTSGVTITITNKIFTLGSIAQFNTSTPHGFTPGSLVQVSGVDNRLDATYRVVTVPSNTAFTVTASYLETVTDKSYGANLATLTTSAATKYTPGVTITVAGVDGMFDGTYLVSAVVGNTVTYARPHTVSITNREYGAALDTITFVTAGAHNLRANDVVTISGAGGIFNSASVPATTFTIVATPATNQFTITRPVSLSVSQKGLTNDVATLSTTLPHNFEPGGTYGMTVSIGDLDFNGPFTVLATNSPTVFTYARTRPSASINNRSFAGGLFSLTTTAPHGFVPGNTVVFSGLDTDNLVNPATVFTLGAGSIGSTLTFPFSHSVPVVNKQMAGNIGTIQTATPHKLLVGHTVSLSGVGGTFDATPFTVATVANATTFTFAMTPSVTVTTKAHALDVSTLTAPGHAFQIGDVITVSGVDSFFNSGGGNPATFTVASVGTPTVNDLTISRTRNSAVSKKAFVGGNAATITTATAHGLSVNDSIQILGTDGVFDTTAAITSVPTATSFTYGRTYQVVPTQRGLTNNAVTLTTAGLHHLSANDTVTVSGFIGSDAFLNGTYVISATPTPTSFTYAKPISSSITFKQFSGANTAQITTAPGHGLVMGDLVTISSVDGVFNGTYPVASVVDAQNFTFARTVSSGVTSKGVSGGSISFKTAAPHNLAVGNTVAVTGLDNLHNGAAYVVATVPDAFNFTAAKAHTPAITFKALANNVATLTTSVAHNLTAGDVITVALTPADPVFDGVGVMVTAAPTANTFSYARPSTFSVNSRMVSGGTATLTTTALHGYSAGQSVTVTGIDPIFDGTYALSAAAGMSLSYARNYGADVSSRTFTGGNTVTLTTSAAHNLSVGATVNVAVGDPVFDGAGLLVTAVVGLNQLQYVRTVIPVVNQKSFAGISATLTTASAHNLHVNDVVNVTGVDGLFNGTVTVTGLPTATTFTYSPSILLRSPNVNAKSYAGGVVTITTEAAHNFASSYGVTLANVDPLVADGSRTISATPGVNVFQFNRNNVAAIDEVAFASDVATLRTSSAHGFTVGNTVVIANVDADLNGTYYITGVPDITHFTVSRPYTTAISNKALSAGEATITTTGSHGLASGDQVVVAGVDSVFNGTYTITALPNATSFRYARTPSAGISQRALASDVATINTGTPHNLQVGNTVTITGIDTVFNGAFTVASVPTATSFTFARPFTSSVTQKSFSGGNAATLTTAAAHNFSPGDQVLISNIDTIFNGAAPYTISSVPSATSFTYTRVLAASVVSKSLVNNVVTLTTGAAHELVPGASINVSSVDGLLNGTYTVASTPTSTTLTYAKPFSAPVTQKQLTGGNLATLETAFAHGFAVNDRVTISGLDTVFNGEHIIAGTPTSSSFNYARIVAANVATKAISGGNLATITTATAHNLQSGDLVRMSAEDGVFNGDYNITVLSGTSFTFPRSYTANISNKQLASDVATFTTAVNHNLVPGETVVVSGVDTVLNGTYTIATTPTATTFTVPKPFSAAVSNKQFSGGNLATITASAHNFTSGDQITVSGVDGAFNGGPFNITVLDANTFTYPRIVNPAVNSVSLVGTTATAQTALAHNLASGNTVVIAGVNNVFNGSYTVLTAPTTTSFTYTKNHLATVSNRQFGGGNTATFTTTANHDLAVGQGVTISGLAGGDAIFNGTYTVATVPTATTFTAAKTYNIGVNNKVFAAGTTTLTTPVAHNLTAGQAVTISSVDTFLNGTFNIATTPTTTTFTYATALTPTVMNKAFNAGTATITTTAAHNLLAGDTVTIASVDGAFNGAYTVAAVPTATSFTYARTVSATVANKSHAAGAATIETAAAHNLAVGNTVDITGVDTVFNGSYLVTGTGVPNANSFTYARALNGVVLNKAISGTTATLITQSPHNLVVGANVTVAGVDNVFNGVAYSVVTVPSSTSFTYVRNHAPALANRALLGATLTLTTAANHELNIGNQITISGVDGIFNGTYTVQDVPSLTTFTVTRGSAFSANVSQKALTGNVATLTTATAHNLAAGNLVDIAGVDGTFNGTYVISTTPTATTFTYARTAADVVAVAATGTMTVNQIGATASAGSASLISVASTAVNPTGNVTLHSFPITVVGGGSAATLTSVSSVGSLGNITLDTRPSTAVVGGQADLQTVPAAATAGSLALTAVPSTLVAGVATLNAVASTPASGTAFYTIASVASGGSSALQTLPTTVGVGVATVQTVASQSVSPAGLAAYTIPSTVVVGGAASLGSFASTAVGPPGVAAYVLGTTVTAGTAALTTVPGTASGGTAAYNLLATPVVGGTADSSTVPSIALNQKTLGGGQAIMRSLAPHNLLPGYQVEIVSSGGVFDGLATIADVPTSTTFTFARSYTRSISNKQLTANTAQLTTTVAHSLEVNSTVVINGVGAPFDGQFVVTAVGAGNLTFDYACTAANVASAPVSPLGTATLTIVGNTAITGNAILRVIPATVVNPVGTATVNSIGNTAVSPTGLATLQTVPAIGGLPVLNGVTLNSVPLNNTPLGFASLVVSPAVATLLGSTATLQTTPTLPVNASVGVTSRSLTGNVATLTTDSPHGYRVGETITVASVDSTFNGIYTVVAVPTATTLTYAKTSGDFLPAAVSPPGTVTFTHAVVNKQLVGTVATLATTLPHGFRVGEAITVSGVDLVFNGPTTVASVLSATSFTYALPFGAVASTPVVGGTVINSAGQAALQTVPIASVTPAGQAAFTISSVAALNGIPLVDLQSHPESSGASGTAFYTVLTQGALPGATIALNARPSTVIDPLVGAMNLTTIPATPVSPIGTARYTVPTVAVVPALNQVVLNTVTSNAVSPASLLTLNTVPFAPVAPNGTASLQTIPPTVVTPSGTVAVSAGRLARVNSSGVFNSAFNENIGSTGNGGFNGSVRAITIAANGDLLVGGDFLGASQFAVPVTNVALAAEIVTVKTRVPHGFASGATAVIESVNGGFNGNFQVLSVPDANTFSYRLDRTNTITTMQLVGGLATLTADANHGLQAGNFVQVAGVHPRLDGGFQILSTTPTTFSYNRLVPANITSKRLDLGTTATITTIPAHGYSSGEQVQIAGVDTIFNGTFTPVLPPGITVIDANNFSYPLTRAFTLSTKQLLVGGTTVRVTTPGNHSLVSGNVVSVSAISTAFDRNNVSVTVVSPTQFDYTAGPVTINPTGRALAGGTTVTVTTPTVHGLVAGSTVTISGGTRAVIFGAIGAPVVAAPSTTTFTYTIGQPTANSADIGRAAGVSTITTTAAHNFAVGDSITITGFTTDATFNGTFTLVAVTGTTLTFAQVGQPDVAAATANVEGTLRMVSGTSTGGLVTYNTVPNSGAGTVTVITVAPTAPLVPATAQSLISITPAAAVLPTGTARLAVITTVTNKSLTASVATLTTAGSHGFQIGAVIQVVGVDPILNGTFTITGSPATNQISYTATGTDIASLPVSPAGQATVTVAPTPSAGTAAHTVTTSRGSPGRAC